MRWWVALLALGGAVASGQSAGRIEGHVLSQSGEPVRKATVRLTGNPPPQNGQAVRSTTYVELSDGTGKFVFDDLPSGRYVLSASKTGFIPPRNTGVSSITLQAGEVKKDAEFKLIQQGVISGRVTDQDGDPVISVQVQALRVNYNGARRQLVPYTSVMSDDQGNFRISNVEPGRYYPMADDPRRIAGTSPDERRGRSAQEVDISTFYPNAPDFSGAVAVEVGPGKEAQGISIRMLKGRTFSIRGTAVDGRNGVASGLQLTLSPKLSGISMPNTRAGAQVQASGAFEFRGLLPGTYVIQGQRAGQVMRGGGDTVTVNPGLVGRAELTISNSDVEGVVLSMSTPAEITGRIRTEEGLPVPSARVMLIDAEENIVQAPSVQINPDATFRIQNIGLSRYTVSVSPLPPGMYVKSARFGGQDATKSLIDMTSGGGGVMEVVLSAKAAEVTAIVRTGSGENVSGVTVSMWSKASGGVDPVIGRNYRTAASGSVRLGDLPPGEYYVAAWEDVDANLLRFPDFLARFTGQAASVRVGESEKVTADLTLIPKDKIAAEVAKLP